MSDLKLSHLMTDSSLAPALKPAFPKLFAGTLAAVFSGLAILTALWGMIQLIGYLSSYWVIFSAVLDSRGSIGSTGLMVSA